MATSVGMNELHVTLGDRSYTFQPRRNGTNRAQPRQRHRGRRSHRLASACPAELRPGRLGVGERRPGAELPGRPAGQPGAAAPSLPAIQLASRPRAGAQPAARRRGRRWRPAWRRRTTTDSSVMDPNRHWLRPARFAGGSDSRPGPGAPPKSATGGRRAPGSPAATRLDPASATPGLRHAGARRRRPARSRTPGQRPRGSPDPSGSSSGAAQQPGASPSDQAKGWASTRLRPRADPARARPPYSDSAPGPGPVRRPRSGAGPVRAAPTSSRESVRGPLTRRRTSSASG